MYRITKHFTFEAAHQLHLPYESKCNGLHGHSYRVQLVLEAATLNGNDMVTDYTDLTEFRIYLDKTFDHRNINTLVAPKQSTAEVLAEYLYSVAKKQWPHLVECRVSETHKTWASYCEGAFSGEGV